MTRNMWIILIVVGLLILGYTQGWFDKILKGGVET